MTGITEVLVGPMVRSTGRPHVVTEQRKHLVNVDVMKSEFGWRYYVSGAAYAEGWRPTRRWALRAGQRVRRRALARLEVDRA